MPPRITPPSSSSVFAPGVNFVPPKTATRNAFANPGGDALNPTTLPAAGFAANTTRVKTQQAARIQKAHEMFLTKLRAAVIAHDQAVATAHIASSVASAKTGLLPVTSKPFGGGKQKASPYQPDLTAKSHVAEAAKALRASGGLATPADRQVLTQAERAVASSQKFTFAQTHILDPALTRPAVSLKPDVTGIGAPAGPKQGPPGSTAVNGREAMQEAAQAAQGPLPGWLSRLASRSEAALGPSILQSLSTQPGFALLGMSPKIAKLSADVHANAMPSLSSIPLGVQVANADLTPAGQAALKAQGAPTMSLHDLIAKYGEGAISVQFRKSLIDQAVKKQGWPGVDTASWTDTDAAARAFTPYTHSLFGFGQNAVADIGSLAAGANIVPMLAGPMLKAAEGNFQPLARTYAQLGQQWKNHLLFVGNQSILENLYQQPFTTVTSNAPVVKMLGERAGLAAGLADTREVTLPTKGAKMEIPATTNIFTRHALAALHDRLLAKGVHPDTHLQAEQPTGLNAEVGMGAARRAVGRVGHHLEKGIIEKHLADQHEGVVLGTGSEARHAQERLKKAIVNLPTKTRDLVGKSERMDTAAGKVKVSSKQTRAEALIDVGRLGMSSDQVAAFFDHQVQLTRGEIANETRIAQELRSQAAQLESEGHIDQANRLAAKAEESEARVRLLPDVMKAQELHAAYARAHPIDIHNLDPREQEVIDAARAVSQATTHLKGDQGDLGEHGQLFGDIEGNLRVTAATEPHTPEGALAREILMHRQARMDLEQRAKDKGFADARSPAARETLGRVKVLRGVLKDVGERRSAAVARRERASATIERQSNAPVTNSTHATKLEAEVHARAHETENPGHVATVHEVKRGRGTVFEVRSKPPAGTAAESAAARAGVAAGTLHRITQEGRSALTRKRATNEIRLNAERRVASEMEQSQRGAHEQTTNAKIQIEQRRLRDWRGRKGAEAERRVPYIEAKIKALRDQLEHFQPDDRLVAQQAKVAKMEAAHAELELSPGEVKAITTKHITAAQEKAIGDVNLHDAIHENQRVGAERELGRLHERLSGDAAAAEARHEAVSGSKADASERIQAHHDAELEGMKRFQEMRQEQEVNPFHITLRRPGDKFGTAKTDVSEGRQFPQGNYTHDMHIQVSANLDATMRTAIIKNLFQEVSQGPLVVRDPPPGSEIPPGFVLGEAEGLANPRKPIYGPEENMDALGEWEDPSRQPGQRVPADGKKYVLISKDAQEWLKKTVGPSRQFGENEKHLNAVLNFTNQYRRWMLYTLPRTLVNNAVGNPIMAAIGGAGMVDYIRAIHILRNHPELMRVTMKHMGPIHNMLQSQKITGYQAWFRGANTFHEDLGRLTVFVHHAVRQFKKDNGLKFYNRVDMASTEMTNYLKDMAEGKHPDGKKFADFATRWFGNMAKKSEYDRVFSTAFLFHRWVGHMIHLTLWTMPLKYPGRTALLLNLSHMADDYRKAHGVLPAWAQGVVGLWDETSKISGLPEKEIWGLNTGGANPFATPEQTLNFGSTSDVKNPVLSGLSANLNPALALAWEVANGTRLDTGLPFKDTKGKTLSPLDWRVMLHQAIGQTPVLSTLFPSTGTADNAFQISPWAPRAYSAAGLSDPSYYPPSAHYGQPWWKDALLRMLAGGGVSIRPIDSSGPRASLSASRAAIAVAKAAAAAHK